MGVKRINKQLACMEDLAIGVGKVSQERAGDTHVLGKLYLHYAVESLEELQSLDPSTCTLAMLGSVKYQYKLTQDEGVESTVGPGKWVVDPRAAVPVLAKSFVPNNFMFVDEATGLLSYKNSAGQVGQVGVNYD